MGNRESQGNRRDRILDAAEELFRERGLHGVSLIDVAFAVGIRKPSLYHHFPAGKEELFLAVQDRMFRRLGGALDKVLQDVRERTEDGENLLAEGLRAASRWFLERPPLFLLSMMHHDMPGLGAEQRAELERSSYGVIMRPIVDLAMDARGRGDLRDIDPHTIAGSFLSMLEGNTIASRAGLGAPLGLMMDASIDLLLYGATPRENCE
ncbi:MAG: TetR/AcrR family transcriptional regulator [Alkalispirochaeta sp.]